MIGQLLDGRYRIASKLGEGGFGHTYLAHDTRIPNEPLCVVKQLKPASNDREYLKIASRLFTSEAQILAKLGNYDRIPRLLAYFDQEGEFYLVEEFIEGRSLESDLGRGYRLSETQVIEILDDLLSILEYVHSHGVIHRDIKPDNIICRQIDHKLVLIDFGAIKQIQNQLNQEGQTLATVAIGTLGYMPSEQAQGKPRPSSDLYAIGVIGIQALTGLPPRELQEDYQTGELIWQHLVSARSGLIDILAKMTRYHYKDRYESASQVRQALALLSSQIANLAPSLQSTIVSVNNSDNTNLVAPVPPTEIHHPAIAQPLTPLPTITTPQITPLPASTTPQTWQINHPTPVSESSSQATVQGYQSSQSKNSSNRKVWWIALWTGAFMTAVAIGSILATRNISSKNIVTSINSPNNLPQSTPPTTEETALNIASPSPLPEAVPTPESPSPSITPIASPSAKGSIQKVITPLSEEDAVDIVTQLVESKDLMFAPPFDRQLLSELTTGEAYEKRKGAIDWLQSNNAYYNYGESTVNRAGSFGIQDDQASLTVEIFESPTLYVNGKIDRAQSQPSKGKYVCTFRFKDGKWKIESLTKI